MAIELKFETKDSLLNLAPGSIPKEYWVIYRKKFGKDWVPGYLGGETYTDYCDLLHKLLEDLELIASADEEIRLVFDESILPIKQNFTRKVIELYQNSRKEK